MLIRLEELRHEGHNLQQMLDERSTADILLCMSVSSQQSDHSSFDNAMDASTEALFQDDIVDKLRSNVYAEVARNLNSCGGQAPTSDGFISSSLSFDDSASEDTNETEKDKFIRCVHKVWNSTPNNRTLIILLFRKQRNRMHAKLSRDRRKLFAAKISETISRLETQNSIMRRRLHYGSLDHYSYSDGSSLHFLLRTESCKGVKC